jgi:hypothetical protein
MVMSFTCALRGLNGCNTAGDWRPFLEKSITGAVIRCILLIIILATRGRSRGVALNMIPDGVRRRLNYAANQRLGLKFCAGKPSVRCLVAYRTEVIRGQVTQLASDADTTCFSIEAANRPTNAF